jgi:hypothetical protein
MDSQTTQQVFGLFPFALAAVGRPQGRDGHQIALQFDHPVASTAIWSTKNQSIS